MAPPPLYPPTYMASAHISRGRLGLRRIGFIVSSWVRSSLAKAFSLVDIVAS